MKTLINEDRPFMEIYKEFQGIMDTAFEESNPEVECKNKWILRLKLDKTVLFDRNITLEEIHYALKSEYKDNIACFYNDLNDEEIIFRIRLTMATNAKEVSQTKFIW